MSLAELTSTIAKYKDSVIPQNLNAWVTAKQNIDSIVQYGKGIFEQRHEIDLSQACDTLHNYCQQALATVAFQLTESSRIVNDMTALQNSFVDIRENEAALIQFQLNFKHDDAARSLLLHKQVSPQRDFLPQARKRKLETFNVSKVPFKQLDLNALDSVGISMAALSRDGVKRDDRGNYAAKQRFTSVNQKSKVPPLAAPMMTINEGLAPPTFNIPAEIAASNATLFTSAPQSGRPSISSENASFAPPPPMPPSIPAPPVVHPLPGPVSPPNPAMASFSAPQFSETQSFAIPAPPSISSFALPPPSAPASFAVPPPPSSIFSVPPPAPINNAFIPPPPPATSTQAQFAPPPPPPVSTIPPSTQYSAAPPPPPPAQSDFMPPPPPPPF